MKLRDNYEKIFENGVNLIEAAGKLAEMSQYGTATSLLILGLEELIKYQVFLDNSGDEKIFEELEIKQVFSNHKTKHKLITEFQEAIKPEFNIKFLEYVFKSSTNQELTESDLEIERNRFKEVGSFLGSMYQEINLSEGEIIDFQNWLIKANDLKNNGFYVGLKNGNWSFPSQIKVEQYERALRYVLAVKSQVEISKNLDLTDDEFIDLLDG